MTEEGGKVGHVHPVWDSRLSPV